MNRILSIFVEGIYNITGVNGALLFAYGFFTGLLLIFSGTLLVIMYNLWARTN
ncbi:hypothetical protein HYG86_10655 [Alkalicella caledoniensis]|uniref:Uncharacterized protein n=1 Tax=Alkalicella caledoniensis TaxID=2731377 RepID=A0A7G9W927_ALKCA|nr:hypothetical protein [Alkalicella caledoniensis]QNO15189.1 hypothetical protein HYG86_10655 [Alkalicella caledoniensis]